MLRLGAEIFAAALLARLEDWTELEGLVDPATAADDDQLSEKALSVQFTAVLHALAPKHAQVSHTSSRVQTSSSATISFPQPG